MKHKVPIDDESQKMWDDLRAIMLPEFPRGRSDLDATVRWLSDYHKIVVGKLSKPASEDWCCKAVRDAMAAGLFHLAFRTATGFITMRVAHCPRCGKKL